MASNIRAFGLEDDLPRVWVLGVLNCFSLHPAHTLQLGLGLYVCLFPEPVSQFFLVPAPRLQLGVVLSGQCLVATVVRPRSFFWVDLTLATLSQ